MYILFVEVLGMTKQLVRTLSLENCRNIFAGNGYENINSSKTSSAGGGGGTEPRTFNFLTQFKRKHF